MKNYTEEEKNLISSLNKPIDNIDKSLVNSIIDKMLYKYYYEELIDFLNSLYDFNAIITAEGRKDCVEGHKRLLQKYNSILQLRGI